MYSCKNCKALLASNKIGEGICSAKGFNYCEPVLSSVTPQELVEALGALHDAVLSLNLESHPNGPVLRDLDAAMSDASRLFDKATGRSPDEPLRELFGQWAKDISKESA
jgi:hypothetical protein